MHIGPLQVLYNCSSASNPMVAVLESVSNGRILFMGGAQCNIQVKARTSANIML